MSGHDISYVRTQMAQAEPAPRNQVGFAGWARRNLFSTPVNTVMTALAIIAIAWFLPRILNWLLFDAVWTGENRAACLTVEQGGQLPAGWSGACWPFVSNRFGYFMFGRYPVDERWRVILCGIIFLVLLVPLLTPRVPFKRLNASLFFVVFPFVAFLLLLGGALPFGLVGFAGWLLQIAVLTIGNIAAGIFSLPAAVLGIFLDGGIVQGLDDIAASVFSPFADISTRLFLLRGGAESGLGGAVSSLWIDLAVSAAIILALMAWMGANRTTIIMTAMLLAAAGLFVRTIGFDVGLPYVETSLWGGLMVTLVLSYVGIVVSLPLGILLALGRRSKMPVVKLLSVIFIETVRGVPLVTVLFMAAFMLPLFVPPGTTFDKLLRALVGVALFASAYMAEVIRGGLQAIPRGQYEGADSLGLGYWQKMGLVVMPQALKLVIPGIVNSFISLFKDTTLVLIISMFDLLGTVKQSISGDPTWATPQTAKTGYIFAALIFWAFCFGMSRYSQYMERRLDTGYRR